MMKCEVCGMIFPDNKVKHKPSSVMIHGCEEDDTYDVCPYCGSGDIYDYEEEVEEDED